MKPTVFARDQRILTSLLLCLGCVALLSSRLNAGSIFDFDDKNPPPPSKATTQSAPEAPQSPKPPPSREATLPQPPRVRTPLSVSEPQSPTFVHPIPDTADRKKSQKLLEEVFAKELADRSPSARRGLAQHLLNEAVKSQSNPADQFVLLIGAKQAAEEAADLTIAFHAIDELARQFDVDGLHLKTESARV